MRKIFVVQQDNTHSANIQIWAEELANSFKHEIDLISIEKNTTAKDFASTMENNDASLVLIELNKKNSIQQYLNLCNRLRIPYVFVQPDAPFNLTRISLPITFLVEDKEKIHFASAFGRFFESQIMIYKPKDYGDKAQETINQAKTLFDSFSLDYMIHQARKGSYDLEREAVDNATSDGAGLVVVSASREYGLDDILFGSKEKRILKSAQVPIMLINPRADLYVLCD